MKVGLLGQFGSGNTGNDGSLEAMLNFLRAASKDTELLCICSNPAAVSETYKIDAISIGGITINNRWFAQINRIFGGMPRRLLSFRAAVSQLKGIELLIIPGTGILDDFQETAFGWPFVIFRWCLAARLRNAQVAFVSIGAGPITQSLSRLFLKSAARMASYRSYRDDLSRNFMKSIGFDVSKDPLVADLAFALPAAAESPAPADGTIRVGVGVMSYSGWKKAGEQGEAIYRTYLQKLDNFVLWLHERGLEVRLLTGDSVDRQAVADLKQMIGEQDGGASVIAEEMTSLHDVMAQISHTDIVVATRYHNVVCALRMGRPVISVGYAEKNDALLTMTGLSDYCHHVETFDVDVLKQQVEEMIADRQRLTQEVKRGVAGFRAKLAEQDVVIGEKLGGAPASALQDEDVVTCATELRQP